MKRELKDKLYPHRKRASQELRGELVGMLLAVAAFKLLTWLPFVLLFVVLYVMASFWYG